ncbi:MAG: phosphocholine-specific phospholipase C, partial [Asticcacaulis sp.]
NVKPAAGGPKQIAPFALKARQTFAHMRVEGTPHSFTDAQAAWDNGRMSRWTEAKHNHSMGYFTREDIPFQFALAEAFTICDAYFCATQTGTNTNRLFIWTGTNDPHAKNNGPAFDNSYDELKADPHGHGGYTWVTYPERLQVAGISWQVYQDEKDNFTDNPLAGFQLFRAAAVAKDGPGVELARRAIRTRHLDKLKEDVLNGTLPQVSWIVAPAADSEHPGPSSPAQGADYTARVLDALTANPAVWARTVFLINFDENDGFFDHVPSPAAPARDPNDPSKLIGGSTVSVSGEYHEHVRNDKDGAYKHRPYGMGPRVPLYVISPWSRGGYVASEVFDHTSVIRFLEARFGVMEPNISPWRRAVAGDLTSCFDFKTPNDKPFFADLPQTLPDAQKAGALPGRTVPPVPAGLSAPVQDKGRRRRRPVPYRPHMTMAAEGGGIRLDLAQASVASKTARAMVYHVYDLKRRAALPARYTVGYGQSLSHTVSQTADLDVWITGPSGFHRRIQGQGVMPLGVETRHEDGLILRVANTAKEAVVFALKDASYGQPEQSLTLAPGEHQELRLDLSKSDNWYDLIVVAGSYRLRLAGHVDTGRDGLTDPAVGGEAPLKPYSLV